MPNEPSLPTAEKLLAAAEEAFAKHGIEGASIRQINDLAGQRNTSAIRYHFGNREGLLEALIERRMGELEEERAALLAALDDSDALVVLDSLVEVLVSPLANRVVREPSWGCWVRILNQLVSVRSHSYQSIWQREHDRTSREIFRRMRQSLRDLPEAVWRQRTADLMTWVTSSLCERARLLESGTRPPLGRQAYVDNLILTTSRALSA
jgi:AcrR family transcriptional regulator